DSFTVAVSLEDANGNVVLTNSTDTVTITVNGQPIPAVQFASGVANFDGSTGANPQIDITKTGKWQLTATTTAVGGNTLSTPIQISPGPVTQIVYVQGPTNTTAGYPMLAVTVAAEDANNNVVTS